MSWISAPLKILRSGDLFRWTAQKISLSLKSPQILSVNSIYKDLKAYLKVLTDPAVVHFIEKAFHQNKYYQYITNFKKVKLKQQKMITWGKNLTIFLSSGK
jgi:hypothetical protein